VVYEAEQTRPVRRRVALKVSSRAWTPRPSRPLRGRAAGAGRHGPPLHRQGATTRGDRPRPALLRHGARQGRADHRLLRPPAADDRQRLELFARVCDAIQHAHTKAIIHRDIKPSNILVEAGDGGEPTVPKVIDFGIAKAMAQKLTEKTLFTERGQMIGTPEYMSPEQAEMSGEDIDTRSDVYSLGVLLYELLTGERPFDLRQAAFIEIQRVIRETRAAEAEHAAAIATMSLCNARTAFTWLLTTILDSAVAILASAGALNFSLTIGRRNFLVFNTVVAMMFLAMALTIWGSIRFIYWRRGGKKLMSTDVSLLVSLVASISIVGVFAAT
jgi:hypothetical protein